MGSFRSLGSVFYRRCLHDFQLGSPMSVHYASDFDTLIKFLSYLIIYFNKNQSFSFTNNHVKIKTLKTTSRVLTIWRENPEISV